MEGPFIIKTSNDTIPKNLATSILKALEVEESIEVQAVGHAISILAKALVIVEKYNTTGNQLYYKPHSKTKTFEDKAFQVLSFVITKKFKEDKVSDDNTLVVDCLNNKQLIESTLAYYKTNGYTYQNSIPITSKGNTSYILMVFEKNEA